VDKEKTDAPGSHGKKGKEKEGQTNFFSEVHDRYLEEYMPAGTLLK
jgi:hypothetical protein